MDENEFNNTYKDLWENKEGAIVLIKSNMPPGYIPYNYKNGTTVLVEDDEIASKLINKMLDYNIPTYDSIGELPKPIENPNYNSLKEWIESLKKKGNNLSDEI